jgi:nickel transport protein
VEFYYASGEPMAYVAVRLFAPGDAAVPFVDGRADKLGHFAFLPSEPGAWTARAEDEEGHKVELTVQAGEAGAPGGSPGGLLSPWRVALWLSLSANLLAVAVRLWARWPAAVQPAAAR